MSGPQYGPGQYGHLRVTAEVLAAEAMAADMDRWITYVPSADKSVQEPFKNWLATNRPSQISRADGVGWICVYAPSYIDSLDDQQVEGRVEVQDSWVALRASGRCVNRQTITELAKTHDITAGKWLFHTSTGLKVDHLWRLIARGVVCGKCGTSAKVSPFDPCDPDGKHVVCVYNRDFTDTAEQMELENAIRGLGIKCTLLYKPDIYTILGIYRNNQWGLHPTINKSVFDLLKMSSTVTDTSAGRDPYSSADSSAHSEPMDVNAI